MVKDSPQNRFFAGAVEVDITPPVGVALSGYGARTQNSIGVHDPLKAQTLFLQLDSAKLLIITCDLIGVDGSLTRQLRQEIAAELDIPTEHIMITCSHTHSGPQGFLPDEPGHISIEDKVLVEITRRKLFGAAKWAVSIKQPATVSFSDLNLTGIGKNRNNPEEGPQDTQLSVLRLDDAEGDPIAVLFNYGCHPTVMGYDNLLITADFPGAARRALKDHFPSCVFLFTNGASGDISTRFTRREQTFSEVNRMGLLIASGVLQAMVKSEPINVDALVGVCVPVQFPLRTLPPMAEITTTIEALKKKKLRLEEEAAPKGVIRKVVTQLEGAQGQLEMVNILKDLSHFTTEIQFLTIGSLFLVGIPGEPFSQTVLDIKAACASKKAIAISYANDSKGYFPDQRSIAENTYEALISPYDQRVSELIYQVTVNQCHKE